MLLFTFPQTMFPEVQFAFICSILSLQHFSSKTFDIYSARKIEIISASMNHKTVMSIIGLIASIKY